MVCDQDHLVGIMQSGGPSPAGVPVEMRIEQHAGFHISNHQIAGAHRLAARLASQDFLGNRHSHRSSPLCHPKA
jgi:hypothetical protein